MELLSSVKEKREFRDSGPCKEKKREKKKPQQLIRCQTMRAELGLVIE